MADQQTPSGSKKKGLSFNMNFNQEKYYNFLY